MNGGMSRIVGVAAVLALSVGGCALVTVGLWMIWRPLGVIAAGAWLFLQAVGFQAQQRRERDK